MYPLLSVAAFVSLCLSTCLSSSARTSSARYIVAISVFLCV